MHLEYYTAGFAADKSSDFFRAASHRLRSISIIIMSSNSAYATVHGDLCHRVSVPIERFPDSLDSSGRLRRDLVSRPMHEDDEEHNRSVNRIDVMYSFTLHPVPRGAADGGVCVPMKFGAALAHAVTLSGEGARYSAHVPEQSQNLPGTLG